MTQNLLLTLAFSPLLIVLVVGIRVLIKYEPKVVPSQYDENGNPQ